MFGLHRAQGKNTGSCKQEVPRNFQGGLDYFAEEWAARRPMKLPKANGLLWDGDSGELVLLEVLEFQPSGSG